MWHKLYRNNMRIHLAVALLMSIQALSLVCQRDQAHESAVAVRLVVSSVELQTERNRHLLCHPALGQFIFFPCSSASLSFSGRTKE